MKLENMKATSGPRFRRAWQNLSSAGDRAGRKLFPRHGRAWLYDQKRADYQAIATVGWAVFCRDAWQTRVGIERCGLSLGIWRLFSFYLTLPFPIWPFKPCEIGWHEGDLTWTLFLHETTCWPREPKVGKWREGRWNLMDFIFGRRSYESVDYESSDGFIPMPEGPYPAKVTLSVATWRRPRWPWWPLRLDRFQSKVECPIGIPYEGKGENSWDCGEDAYWSIGGTARSATEAVTSAARSVLERRDRYGKTGPGAYPHPDERAKRSQGDDA